MFLFRARLDHDLNSEVLPERYTTLFHLDPTLVFEKVAAGLAIQNGHKDVYMPKGKLLSREAKLRANGLLDMYYMPSELADELAIDQRDIYRKLLPAGLPHKKDAAGHIWLHGPEIAQWIQTLNTKPQPMDEHEGYCLKCGALSRW